MRITVTGRHTDVSESLKAYANEKASKLERYYDRVISVEVVFDKTAGHCECEVIAQADHHHTFVAKEEHEKAFASLDAAVKDIERQLRRYKERFRNRKHITGLSERERLGDSSAQSAETETETEGEGS